MAISEPSQHRDAVVEFNTLMQTAIAQPMNADLESLWQQLNQMLGQLPQVDLLAVAGEAIAQFADIYAARAEVMLKEWESKYTISTSELEEPVLPDDLLSGLLRQTMSLDLEDLMEEADFQRRKGRSYPEDSIAADVDKQAVLTMIDQIELAQVVLQTTHAESLSEWSTTIQQWIEQQSQPVGLESILLNVKLSPVQIWLGLLLANPSYQWTHVWKTDEEFYLPTSIRLLIAPPA